MFPTALLPAAAGVAIAGTGCWISRNATQTAPKPEETRAAPATLAVTQTAVTQTAPTPLPTATAVPKPNGR